ncbi:hypothetical protein GF357_03960 [Candidatus Dojkabacteria bacterium]|nr:hypothetical protein [Candidatus Dojkabacteria bacterium]
MPNLDGTGPGGKGPRTGRGRGNSRGSSGQGRGGKRQGLGGSSECVCPKCGHTVDHKRGVPCSDSKCQKCGTSMRGQFCK